MVFPGLIYSWKEERGPFSETHLSLPIEHWLIFFVWVRNWVSVYTWVKDSGRLALWVFFSFPSGIFQFSAWRNSPSLLPLRLLFVVRVGRFGRSSFRIEGSLLDSDRCEFLGLRSISYSKRIAVSAGTPRRRGRVRALPPCYGYGRPLCLKVPEYMKWLCGDLLGWNLVHAWLRRLPSWWESGAILSWCRCRAADHPCWSDGTIGTQIEAFDWARLVI